MATTKKNSTDEFIEMNTDDTSSFAESNQRESQLLAELEAQGEQEFSPSLGYEENKPDALTTRLFEFLLKQSQTDDSIRRIVKEAVDDYEKHNAPIRTPADSPEVKQLKARIAVLKGYYPVTWV